MDVLLCIFFLACHVLEILLYFSRRNNLIRLSPAILHFFSIHCFFIPQCSISNLFQHRNHDDFATMAGFTFVYMEDERDADYAIRRLDRTEFGRKGPRYVLSGLSKNMTVEGQVVIQRNLQLIRGHLRLCLS